MGALKRWKKHAVLSNKVDFKNMVSSDEWFL